MYYILYTTSNKNMSMSMSTDDHNLEVWIWHCNNQAFRRQREGEKKRGKLRRGTCRKGRIVFEISVGCQMR